MRMIFRSARWLPAVLVLLANPPGADAQRLSTRCSRERADAPARISPEVQARLGLRRAIEGELYQQVHAGSVAAGVPAPTGLAFFSVDLGAGSSRAWVYDSNVPVTVVEGVFRTTRPALELYAAEEGERRATLYVRLDSLPEAPPAPGFVTECLPRLRNARIIRERLGSLSRRIGNYVDLRVELRLVLSRDGEIAFAEVMRTSGNREADEEVLELARRMEFAIPVLQGVPMDVWIEQPMILYGSRRPRP